MAKYLLLVSVSTENTSTRSGKKGVSLIIVICIIIITAVVPLTRHVDHPAVAVLHQVPRLAVDPARCDAVAAEEVGVHRRGLAVPPRRRQVCQLGGWMETTAGSHLEPHVRETHPCLDNATVSTSRSPVYPPTNCFWGAAVRSLSAALTRNLGVYSTQRLRPTSLLSFGMQRAVEHWQHDQVGINSKKERLLQTGFHEVGTVTWQLEGLIPGGNNDGCLSLSPAYTQRQLG